MLFPVWAQRQKILGVYFFAVAVTIDLFESRNTGCDIQLIFCGIESWDGVGCAEKRIIFCTLHCGVEAMSLAVDPTHIKAKFATYACVGAIAGAKDV